MKINEPSNTVLVGIYGAGGFGREVAQMLHASNNKRPKTPVTSRTVFVETSPERDEANGLPVISEDEFFNVFCSEKLFTVAIASSSVRRLVALRMIQRGATPMSVVSRESIIDPSARIGEGAIIGPFVSINANTSIGSFFHANMYSYVAHDAIIGDFVTLAPRVSVNGNVHISHDVFVGTNAVIKQGSGHTPLTIGNGAFIGMGALVSKNVEQGTTVVGYPAREIPASP